MESVNGYIQGVGAVITRKPLRSVPYHYQDDSKTFEHIDKRVAFFHSYFFMRQKYILFLILQNN